jgi:hypothetical protein
MTGLPRIDLQVSGRTKTHIVGLIDELGLTIENCVLTRPSWITTNLGPKKDLENSIFTITIEVPRVLERNRKLFKNVLCS